MLIYEKKVDGVNHLFGTEANIPADDDTQLTYKDENGDAISDISDYKFFYEKNKVMFGSEATNQLPTDEDTQVNVWLGDEMIIPQVTYSITYEEVEHATITPASGTRYTNGETVEVTNEVESGYTFESAPVFTVNGEEITAEWDNAVASFDVVVERDTVIVLVSSIVEASPLD